jgi:hypothetical protein
MVEQLLGRSFRLCTACRDTNLCRTTRAAYHICNYEMGVIMSMQVLQRGDRIALEALPEIAFLVDDVLLPGA